MRDSTNPADIPLQGLQLVAGYVNGRFMWNSMEWGRFPAEVARVHIDVDGTAYKTAGVLDVETGDATPQEAAVWVMARKRLGAGATGCTIYCNRSTINPVHASMAAAGLAIGRDYTLWVATLDGTEILPTMTGVVAVQARGEAQTGGHYDESIVYDDQWHPSPVPPPVPGPPWQQTALMAAQRAQVAVGDLVKLLEAHQ
jgi:hypothetical protein